MEELQLDRKSYQFWKKKLLAEEHSEAEKTLERIERSENPLKNRLSALNPDRHLPRSTSDELWHWPKTLQYSLIIDDKYITSLP